MSDNVQYERIINGNETMNRVIYDLADALARTLLSVLLKLSGQMYKGRADKKDLLV